MLVWKNTGAISMIAPEASKQRYSESSAGHIWYVISPQGRYVELLDNTHTAKPP